MIKKPDKFGFNKDFIEFVYNNYGERIGTEGKAREQIMLSLFNEGWIRIRQYKQFWSINVKKFSGKARTYITLWSKKILKGFHGFKEQDKHAVIKIDQKDKPIETWDLMDLTEAVDFTFTHILLETNIEDMPDLPLYDIVNEILTNGIKKINLKDYLQRK